MSQYPTNGFAIGMLMACLATAASAATPPTSNAGLAGFIQRQNETPNPNIGKPIPAGLTVLDSSGRTVQLRDAIRGPAVIVKTFDGCPPCSVLGGYLDAHAADYMRAHHAQIVVITIGAAKAPTGSSYPQGVLALHTPGAMQGSLFGGTDVPAIYFIGQDQTLVGQHPGIYNGTDEAMAAALAFPPPGSVQ